MRENSKLVDGLELIVPCGGGFLINMYRSHREGRSNFFTNLSDGMSQSRLDKKAAAGMVFYGLYQVGTLAGLVYYLVTK